MLTKFHSLELPLKDKPKRVNMAEEIRAGSPGILRQAGHLLKAAGRIISHTVAEGFIPLATADHVKARAAICAACKFWDADGNLGLGKCNHPRCGCTKWKMEWLTERCPDGLWKSVDAQFNPVKKPLTQPAMKDKHTP